MDHQDIAQLLGNYGEFIGAIAVVTTLIYLVVQIRQNTNTIAGATEMELARELTAWHARITAEPELIQLYNKAAANEPMSDSESARYLWLIAELLWLYEGAYRQYLRGLISNQNWESHANTALGLLSGDILSTWWESRSSSLSAEFVEYLDQRRTEDKGEGWRPRSPVQ